MRTIKVIRHPRMYRSRGRMKTTTVRKHPRKVYVPPAWKNVKYYTNKPYLATGIDVKGRLQYRQDPLFKKQQAKKKFSRIDRLEKQMPSILTKVLRDADKGNQEAMVVYTIYKTGFRPGSDADTMADKKAFGVTTLQKRHVEIKPNGVIKFRFTSKKGVPVEKDVKDGRLSKFIKQQLISNRLFGTDSIKVRRYFNKKTQDRFKLKDLRTLKAQKIGKFIARQKDATPKLIKQGVSEGLDNTPTVAGQAYINPKLLS